MAVDIVPRELLKLMDRGEASRVGWLRAPLEPVLVGGRDGISHWA